MAFNRREVVKQGVAAALAGAAPLAALRPRPVLAAEPELVFASDGGSYQKTFETELFPEFSRRTGVKKLTFVAGQPADNLAKLRVQKGRPAMDVIWLAGAVTYQAADEGLLEEVDATKIPNLKSIRQDLLTEKFSAPAGISSMGVLYNKEIFAQHGFARPTSWWDLWNPKFKNRVATFSSNVTGEIAMLTLMARALTGDWKNLDPAFQKLRQLRPNVVDFFTSAGNLDRAIQQRDVWISTHAVQGAIQHIRAGLPIGFVQPKEGVPGYTASVGIVKGAPHPNAARAWVDYLLSAEAQSILALKMGYVPVHPKAHIPQQYSNFYPDLAKVFIPDWRYLTSQLPSIVERWNRVVEG